MFSILNSHAARGQIRPTVWKFFLPFLRRLAAGMTAHQKVALKLLNLRSRPNPRAADSWPVNCHVINCPVRARSVPRQERAGSFAAANSFRVHSNTTILQDRH